MMEMGGFIWWKQEQVFKARQMLCMDQQVILFCSLPWPPSIFKPLFVLCNLVFGMLKKIEKGWIGVFFFLTR